MGRNAIKKPRLKNPKKRQEIIDGLIAFFRENSLAASTMDEVAEGIGKSKATLYKYFPTKEKMVGELVSYKVTEISKFALILQDESIPFIKRYELSFQLLEQHIADISNDFLEDLQSVFPVIYKYIEQLIDLAVNELTQYYEKGMQLGLFNNLNARMLSLNDFIMFRSFTNPQFLKENQTTIRQAFIDYYEIRCMGLLR
ncbi:MAG: TetR/AcrR family transcriptional regulator [Chitinophagales bacterium]|nr:TetR/AcrR family transcriptional regulator [Chitinophagales bacterium]